MACQVTIPVLCGVRVPGRVYSMAIEVFYNSGDVRLPASAGTASSIVVVVVVVAVVVVAVVVDVLVGVVLH